MGEAEQGYREEKRKKKKDMRLMSEESPKATQPGRKLGDFTNIVINHYVYS